MAHNPEVVGSFPDAQGYERSLQQSKLIESSMKAYQRSRGTKVKFKYETLPVAGTEERRLFDTLVKKRL